MKDNEVHIGLDNKEIRDFFATSLANFIKDELKQQPNYHEFIGKLGNIEYRIECSKVKLYNEQIELNRLTELYAIHTLIDKQGWSEFDISDFVSKSTPTEYYRSFYGTNDEYENFMKSNEFEY